MRSESRGKLPGRTGCAAVLAPVTSMPRAAWAIFTFACMLTEGQAPIHCILSPETALSDVSDSLHTQG
ncbi:hypothetical protein NDU88_007368 [Pleurodeles waltl]|uniref:Uncharacterized protein n=1 Tax=Pleurodeles waltl TaxID=8319 RepID=A0AAV7U1A8_PLEWA|nr:hypothetical protein NDU88_007368 [Pleurodeles waltl]